MNKCRMRAINRTIGLKYLSQKSKNDKRAADLCIKNASWPVEASFEIEVPEIYDGTVELKSVAREAGDRSKISVRTDDPDVDPVGSCVGPKGQRVQAIVNELKGEKLISSTGLMIRLNLLPMRSARLKCWMSSSAKKKSHDCHRS